MTESLNNKNVELLAPNGDIKKIFERKTEVILLDYFYVLLRRKFLVASIFIFIVIVAVIVNLFLPKTFEAKGILSIGKYKNQQIEQVIDLRTIVYAEPSLKALAAKMDLPETSIGMIGRSFDISIATEADKKSSFIKVAGKGKTPEVTLKLTNIVISFILQRHEMLFTEAQKLFNLEIEAIKRNLEKTKSDIAETEKLINAMDNDLKFYNAEIKSRASVQSEAQGRIVQSYIELLNSTKKEKEAMIMKLAGLKLDLKNFDLQFQQKELEKKYETNPTHVEIEPLLPTEKIAPKRRQNVTFATVIALFISILSGFAVEYVAENKNRRHVLNQEQTINKNTSSLPSEL